MESVEAGMAKLREIHEVMEQIGRDSGKFFQKGNKAAGVRARKALQDLKALAQDLRVAIQRCKCETAHTQMTGEQRAAVQRAAVLAPPCEPGSTVEVGGHSAALSSPHDISPHAHLAPPLPPPLQQQHSQMYAQHHAHMHAHAGVGTIRETGRDSMEAEHTTSVLPPLLDAVDMAGTVAGGMGSGTGAMQNGMSDGVGDGGGGGSSGDMAHLLDGRMGQGGGGGMVAGVHHSGGLDAALVGTTMPPLGTALQTHTGASIGHGGQHGTAALEQHPELGGTLSGALAAHTRTAV